eukprot:6202884-Pleurochrysis_carterae.AAC.3
MSIRNAHQYQAQVSSSNIDIDEGGFNYPECGMESVLPLRSMFYVSVEELPFLKSAIHKPISLYTSKYVVIDSFDRRIAAASFGTSCRHRQIGWRLVLGRVRET